MEKIAKNLQLLLMCIILISTVIAVGIEIYKMFQNKKIWVASSTHNSEEEFCAKAHIELKKKFNNFND